MKVTPLKFLISSNLRLFAALLACVLMSAACDDGGDGSSVRDAGVVDAQADAVEDSGPETGVVDAAEGDTSSSQQAAIARCEDVCARLDACSLGAASCQDDCLNTIAGWAEEPQSDLVWCIENFECSELGSSATDAFRTCYAHLPIDTVRRDDCIIITEAMAACIGQADDVGQACLHVARTGTEASWSEAQTCLTPAGAEDCQALETCVGNVFGIEL
jgi:hypothetical protein